MFASISSVPGLQVNCVSPNTRTYTVTPKVPRHLMNIKFVDYSGFRDGSRVMGVGLCEDGRMVVDDILSWRVPDSWSDQQAASVPCVYALAFYSMFAKAELNGDKSVLIHCGQSTLGRALIALSIAEGAEVFTTVDQESQASALLKQFPQIGRRKVINLERTRFELEIKRQTKGLGVDVVVNCLPHEKNANASLRVLAVKGRLIHLSDILPGRFEQIGTYPFLNPGTYMYGVSLDSVFTADKEIKVKLRLQVERGIALGFVTPFELRTFDVEKCVDDAMSHFQFNNSAGKTVLTGINQRCIYGNPVLRTSCDSAIRMAENTLENSTTHKEKYHEPCDFEDVKHYLPSSLDELADIGAEESFQIQELATLTPRFEHISHQLLPVFFVPGTCADLIRPLARRLMTAAFSLPVHGTSGLQQTAREYAQLIQSIQPHGPYHVVADPWSGRLTLTVAAILESARQQVTVFLLGAELSSEQKRAKMFSDRDGAFDDARFIRHLFQLSEETSRSCGHLMSWEEQLQITLDQGHGLEDRHRKRVARGATALRGRLIAALEGEVEWHDFEGTVHLLVPSNNQLSTISPNYKRAPRVHVVQDDVYFEGLMENKNTAAFINANLVFSWNL